MSDEPTELPIENAPLQTTTIAGIEIHVPAPFYEGYSLREQDADVLNQAYANYVRNTMMKKVKEQQEEHGKEKVTASQVQPQVDEVVKTYDFGRRGAGGGAPKKDEVTQQAEALAWDRIKEALKAKGKKVSDLSKEKKQELIEEAVDNHPEFRETAEQIVQQKQSLESSMGEVAV